MGLLELELWQLCEEAMRILATETTFVWSCCAPLDFIFDLWLLIKKKKSSFGFVERDDRVNTAAYIILKLWIISKIKLMVIAGVFSSSLKFSVNPLLAVYFPSSIHVAALILFGPAEVPEEAESNLLEKCIES